MPVLRTLYAWNHLDKSVYIGHDVATKKRKQRHSLKLDKKRQESSKRNYYIITPRVLIYSSLEPLLEGLFAQIYIDLS